MISKLRGIFDSSGPNWACIDVNGVFYHVFCSAKTLDDLCNGETNGYGQEVKLIIEMVVREDLMALYGFTSSQEHEWFQVLTSVQGVGMKVALAILSVSTPSQLYNAVIAGDKATFSMADGVGPKLASRLVNELKDKVKKQFGDRPLAANDLGGHAISKQSDQSAFSNSSSKGIDSRFDDTASALLNLGYKPFEVNQVITKLRHNDVEGSVESLVPLALQMMTKNSG